MKKARAPASDTTISPQLTIHNIISDALKVDPAQAECQTSDYMAGGSGNANLFVINNMSAIPLKRTLP